MSHERITVVRFRVEGADPLPAGVVRPIGPASARLRSKSRRFAANPQPGVIVQEAVERIRDTLAPCDPMLVSVVEEAFTAAPVQVRDLAEFAGFEHVTTFTSIFWRAQVPPLRHIRNVGILVRAADKILVEGCSVTRAADDMGCSAPQHLHRALRLLGFSPRALNRNRVLLFVVDQFAPYASRFRQIRLTSRGLQEAR